MAVPRCCLVPYAFRTAGRPAGCACQPRQQVQQHTDFTTVRGSAVRRFDTCSLVAKYQTALRKHISNYTNTPTFASLIFNKSVANSRKQFRYLIASKSDDNRTKYNTNFVRTLQHRVALAALIVTEQICQRQTLAGNVQSQFHAQL